MYSSDDERDKFQFLLTDSNLCLKYEKKRRGWLHQPSESGSDGEYFKLCKILREFPDKFRECYRMNIKTYDYILVSVQDDLQGCSNFRKCIETEEKLTVVLRYVLVFGIKINKLHLHNCKCYKNSV